MNGRRTATTMQLSIIPCASAHAAAISNTDGKGQVMWHVIRGITMALSVMQVIGEAINVRR